MKTIYKYKLNYTNVPEIIRLPLGATIVDYGVKNKQVFIWALVDTKKEIEKRVFVLAFTGQEIPWKIVKSYGSRIIAESGIVIHLLELIDVKEGSGELLANDPEKDERLNEK